MPLPPSSTVWMGKPCQRGCPFSMTLNNKVPCSSCPVSGVITAVVDRNFYAFLAERTAVVVRERTSISSVGKRAKRQNCHCRT